jgi:hypothetical protein
VQLPSQQQQQQQTATSVRQLLPLAMAATLVVLA